MRRIGLIGGTTWLSTVEYYRNLNLMTNERLGGSDFAELTLESLNFGALSRNQLAGKIEANTGILSAAAKRLAATGVEGIGLCANTMHLWAGEIAAASNLPVIHIAKAVCESVKAKGLSRVGLLGTRFTMEKDVYFSILQEAGIECIVPDQQDRTTINESIFSELAKDRFTDQLRRVYLEIIERLAGKEAEGVILGCTEIPLLLAPEQIPMPSFDTTKIHSTALVDFMLGSKNA